ncbi:unnamed protein product [Lupinus luteus]|uniref:RNase H type-1 domain-containing protein n=1 Tax=Lupinus luteus TaxID=3873 RepID=A0AAV1VQG6_LUPLU
MRFNSINFYINGDALTWVKDNCIHSGNSFLATLWWSWRSRNMSCLDNNNLSLHSICFQALRLKNDLDLGFPSPPNATPIPRMVHWSRPNFPYLALNVDGSSLGNPGPSSFGGILRDHTGRFIFSYSGSIGISNNLKVELSTVHQGLKLCWNRGIKKLICWSDSLDIVSLINNTATTTHIYSSLILVIRDLITLDWDIKLLHTLREGNACADFLAKLGVANTIHLVIYDSPHHELESMLLVDAMETPFVRR